MPEDWKQPFFTSLTTAQHYCAGEGDAQGRLVARMRHRPRLGAAVGYIGLRHVDAAKRGPPHLALQPSVGAHVQRLREAS